LWISADENQHVCVLVWIKTENQYCFGKGKNLTAEYLICMESKTAHSVLLCNQCERALESYPTFVSTGIEDA
jgi:hypothetical protein